MSIIPFIIIDERIDYNGKCEKYLDYSFVSEEKLKKTLLKELHYCMEYHCFFDNSEEDADADADADADTVADADTDADVKLTCSECECIVLSKKFITKINDSLFCFACNPSETIGDYITKELFDKFTIFLNKNDEICEILYFSNNKWNKFIIE